MQFVWLILLRGIVKHYDYRVVWRFYRSEPLYEMYNVQMNMTDCTRDSPSLDQT